MFCSTLFGKAAPELLRQKRRDENQERVADLRSLCGTAPRFSSIIKEKDTIGGLFRGVSVLLLIMRRDPHLTVGAPLTLRMHHVYSRCENVFQNLDQRGITPSTKQSEPGLCCVNKNVMFPSNRARFDFGNYKR